MSTHRSSLCVFTFADGRRCRTPRYSNHPHLCYDHARKEAQATAAEKIGGDLAYLFSGPLITAGDLNAALAQVFAAVAKGHIKPGTASALGYLGQTMLQNMQNTKHEYVQARGADSWRKVVHISIVNNNDFIERQFADTQPPVPSQLPPAQPHAPAEPPGTDANASPQAEAGTQPEPAAVKSGTEPATS